MSEYRIDELARVAGMTVRNVRAYQDRGLVPSPRRQGRIGLYSGAHLARLRLIGDLLERGFSLANIGELIAAWERGQDVADLLGFESVLVAPWSEEAEAVVAPEEVLEMLGGRIPPEDLPGVLAEAVALDVLDVEGDRFRVRSPALLRAGAVLIEAGVPTGAIFDVGRAVLEAMDGIARAFVELVVTHVIEPAGEPLPSGEARRLTEVVDKLRPLAKQVVDADLARTMERHIQREIGERLGRLLTQGEGRAAAS